MDSKKSRSIPLTTTSVSLAALAAFHIPQSQQVAQASEECHGGQILTATTCAGDGLEPEEAKLYQLVNQYRAQNRLPAIPLSKSLTLVANRHVRDLDENIGALTHGWSNCPYNPSNQSTWPCMWEAPQRFKTAYPGRGYENAHGGSGRYRASAVSALQGWQGSRLHNAVILNLGNWQNNQWQALGIGIYKGYAVLWFGEEPDPANIASNPPRNTAPVSRPQNPSSSRSARTWNTPALRGVPIDATVWENDANPQNEQAAAQEGANLFCQSQGYDCASSWAVGKGQRITVERGTYRFNRGNPRNPSYCNWCRWHLISVTCSSASQRSNSAPQQPVQAPPSYTPPARSAPERLW